MIFASIASRLGRSRMTALILFLSVLGMIISPAPSRAQADVSLRDIEIVSLFVEGSEDDSNFTVIDSRMDETGTAGVFFGVVGAGLNSAANASEDDKKADTLRAAADELDLQALLADAVAGTIAAKETPPLSGDRGAASHVLLVEIRNWGLMRKSRDDERMRVFLNLTLSLLDPKGKTVWEKKRENAVGADAANFEDYDGALLAAEMTALAEKTGKYVAYQIIYR